MSDILIDGLKEVESVVVDDGIKLIDVLSRIENPETVILIIVLFVCATFFGIKLLTVLSTSRWLKKNPPAPPPTSHGSETRLAKQVLLHLSKIDRKIDALLIRQQNSPTNKHQKKPAK